jgi:hypothetical protein
VPESSERQHQDVALKAGTVTFLAGTIKFVSRNSIVGGQFLKTWFAMSGEIFPLG